MTRSAPCAKTLPATIDLALVAQRILKLADIAVLEHLDALDRSQGANLSEMLGRCEAENGVDEVVPGR